MPKFRTPKSKRTVYTYKDAKGHEYTITPGAEDADGQAITSNHILLLHAEDDAVHNAAKRDAYHGVSLTKEKPDPDDKPHRKQQTDHPDYTYDPATQLLSNIDAIEHSSAFRAEWDKLTDKQRDLILKKALGRTNVDIAKEEGVTETAIRNRLAKIQKRFEKFLD